MELLGCLFLIFLRVAVLGLAAVANIFQASANLLNVYFVRCGTRFDRKYTQSEPTNTGYAGEPEVIFVDPSAN